MIKFLNKRQTNSKSELTSRCKNAPPLSQGFNLKRRNNMTNSKESCCTGDVVSSALSKVGINRSLLITLALLPFAWEGVNWVTGAVRELWNLVASV